MTVALDASTPAHLSTTPASIRIGLLGLGNIGSAVARLARDAAAPLRTHGLQPVLGAALVRSAGRSHAAASLVSEVTDDPDRFFADAPDIVVEALGGAEPAHTLVARALDRGIPVVTANKSLIAAHGHELSALARRRGTALRYEASCIAGVPFLGTYERRPLATRVHRVTAILNGTSNTILSALEKGVEYAGALADAQRRGLAEPDPSADISGADAAQKLTILVWLFARRRIDPAAIASVPLDVLQPRDLDVCAAWGHRIKPLAQASWEGPHLRAFVAPTAVPAGHPLASLTDVTNGILIEGIDGAFCYTGPGAGPAVTAATLLDDVVEVAREGPGRHPPELSVPPAANVTHPLTGWVLRVDGVTPQATADALSSRGICFWRLTARQNGCYALTFPAPAERVAAARETLQALGGRDVLAIPALPGAGEC